jgi:hypothetical protein
MSIPRKHHYLPEFYLNRWACNGKVVRYLRPRGHGNELDTRRVAPGAVAYERDLYQLPDLADPSDSQALELKFFQQIDDRAAVALSKLDQLIEGSADDRIALSRFLLSLLHRSPSRLALIRQELAEQVTGAPFQGLQGDHYEAVLKSTANRLLAMLVDSDEGISFLGKFKTFKIDTSESSKSLLTSDRPLTLSAQLVAPDAFMILPYAPDRLMLLARAEKVALSFSSQDPTTLVSGINQAVVEQSEDVIIASDRQAERMIDRLFLRRNPNSTLDSIGLIRRKSPLVDLGPRPRSFSRHDMVGMKYLGE